MAYDPKKGFDPDNPDDPRRNEAIDPKTGERLPPSEAHLEPVRAFRLKHVDNPAMQPSHVHNGKPIAPGDVVNLTKSQAEAFKDRFEPVDPAATFEPRGVSREAFHKNAEAKVATVDSKK